jgi:hypothetical protein
MSEPEKDSQFCKIIKDVFWEFLFRHIVRNKTVGQNFFKFCMLLEYDERKI